MKNTLTGFICGVLVTILFGTGLFTLADGIWKTIDVLENDISVIVDGETISETNFLYEGKTYVPIRAVSDAIGKKVTYDETTRTAYIGTNPKKTADDEISHIISAPLDTYEEVRDLYYPNLNFYQKGNFYVSMNAEGGISLNWCAKNISDKDIKNITLTVRLYDYDSNLITDNNGNSTFNLRKLGPIYAGSSFRVRNSKPFAHAGTCVEVFIDEITVSFMDGTKVSGMYGYSTTWIR